LFAIISLPFNHKFMEKTPRPEGREKEPTPQELAQSWLSSKQEQVEKSIQAAQQGLRFNKTYEPKIPTERGEPGSMDASDYTVASLEVDEWLQGGREEALARDEIRLAELHRETEELAEMKTRIEQGDTSLIELFAAHERERRQRVAETEALKKEREGKEFEGAEKVSAQIKEVWDLVKSGKIPVRKEMRGEWKLSHDFGDQVQFYYKDGKGPMDGYAVFISLSPKGDEFHVWYENVENVQTDPAKKGKWGEATTSGTGLFFNIKENVVSAQSVTSPRPQRMFGYVEVENNATGARFEQSHLDEFRAKLEALVADIKQTIEQK